MKKVLSIRTKNMWLGIGIFVAFLILQISIGYRLFDIKENVNNSQNHLHQQIHLQKIYIELLQFEDDKDMSHIDKIRETLIFLEPIHQNRIKQYLNNIERYKDEENNLKHLNSYLKDAITELRMKLQKSDTIDITKENIIMFVIILIINIIINVALYFFAKQIISNIETLQNGLLSFFDYLNRDIDNPTKLNINSKMNLKQSQI